MVYRLEAYDDDDVVSLKKVYEAVGIHFLDRLLRTGSGNGGENRDVYLQLSITVLATFCRVPEIASSVEMVSRIPFILDVMSKGPSANILEGCYEILYLVSTACEDGVMTLMNSGGLRVISPQMSDLPDGSQVMEVAIKILQLLVSKLSSESMNIERFFELSLVVAAVARQFAVLHNALKFEAMHLLSAVFCSEYAVSFYCDLIISLIISHPLIIKQMIRCFNFISSFQKMITWNDDMKW